MPPQPIANDLLEADNLSRRSALEADYSALGESLARRGGDIDRVKTAVAGLEIAIPTWGVGTGGTRFARFPMGGEPRHIWDKIEDCGVIRQLARITPRVSPHFPWDRVDDFQALREHAAQYDLGFDAVNSNTFQDRPGQDHSYKFGSLTHTNRATRGAGRCP